MAVFFDIGGDIYGGPDRESVIKQMREDMGNDFDEGDVEEVSAEKTVTLTDEHDEPTEETSTLAELFGEDTDTFCIASTNF